jgi:hypothetical protein
MAAYQPLNSITSALRSIGALATGETPDANTATDCFNLLNEMLDQWSNDHLLVFTQQEVIQELTGEGFIYTIGPGGSVGASFTGSISGTVLTVTNLASGALSAGQIISSSTGTGTLTAGTAITSLGTATGGNASGALGTYNLNLPNTITSGTVVSYAPRPLKITSAFVRVVNSATGTLDYPVAVLSYEEYQSIGIKTLPGPWPRGVYLQPTMPLAILNYWPNPSQGEMHLFCDTVLNNFATLYDQVTLPQGYQGALHWCLAELLMPEFGKADPGQVMMITKQAAKARMMIQRINMRPQAPAFYDPALQQKARRDAGWILSGGQ